MALRALADASLRGRVGLTEEEVQRLRTAFEWWEPFRDRLLEERPVEGSVGEGEELVKFATEMFKTGRAVGPSMLSVLADDVHSLIDHMFDRSEQEIELEKKLGLRVLQQAWDSLGRIVDRFLESTPPTLRGALYELPAVPSELLAALNEREVLLLRLELQCFIAFDLISEGSSTDFCVWALDAANTARRLEATYSSFEPFIDAVGLETALDADIGQLAPTQIVGELYSQGYIEVDAAAALLHMHPSDVVAILEENGHRRSVETLRLTNDQRESRLQAIRRDRLHRSGRPIYSRDLVLRDALASERIEGVDARPWITKPTS